MADPGPDDDVVIVEDFDDCPVRKALVAKLASALEKHPGGPASYLAAHLQNDGEKQNFVNWLWKSFPERDDVCYHHSADIPWVAEQQLAQTPPVAIHIACFGWEDGCGMKPPPGKDLTLQLVEWYLKDGFISSGEVLLVSQPQALAASSLTAPWTGDLKPCSVGYIKGRARMTALLAILHVIYSDETGMDLTPCQKFMESVNLIWVQHLRQATKEDEVLCNLKMSLRGSLRKAANVVQMASMVRRLMQEGSTDYGSFVRRFNSQTVPAYQIRGRKATALKLLFESDVLDAVLDHVGALGWPDCAWTEENLSSKRLFPGHQFPSRSRKWMARLKVSDDSLRLMATRVHWVREKAHQANLGKGKMDGASMEAVAEKAAALHALALEFCSEHPVPLETVKQRVLTEWSQGCERIDCEISAALLEKSDSFQIAQQMPCFKSLLEDSLFRTPVSSAQELDLRDALKKDEYDHLIKKMDYDQKVFEIWRQKCTSVSAARTHARQEHLVSQHRQLQESAEHFVEGCVRLLCWENSKGSDTLLPQILAFRMEVMKKLRNSGIVAEVPTVVLMNWTAPCLLPSARQRDHSNVLAWALHDNVNSVGVVFSPTFSYNRGKTFLEEHTGYEMLLQGGHNLDHQFSLIFSDRCDQRDSRPLVYPARFAFPGHVVDLSKSNAFFASELRKSGRTDAVKQLPAKELKEMEDMADDSLPSSTSANFVSGAAKHCQMGQPAAEEILKKLFAGTEFENAPAILILDLFPRVGDFCHAFCKLRSNTNVGAQLFYVGVAEKAKDQEWLRASLLDELVEKLKQGQFQIPGARPFQHDVPGDLLEALPA
ncbi:unnamed protein product [Durusdinium trenchii]|uniref:Uncharacterized protein n=2 Tax=Durusdinium trenchii TaxID=1381693 RepID=A0ABP0RBA7_9DINO